MFSSWFASFVPSALNTRPKEWLRAAFGAALGVLLSALVCRQVFGSEVALHLMGPLGASAILLFAVSSGALAQPWSIVGSYLTATVVALLMVHFFGRSLGSASLAVGISLALMCPLRCLHPPGGAVALCVVLAGPAMVNMGFMLLYPVLLNALCLLGCALLYNNLTRVRYPKSHMTPATDLHHTHDPSPEQRVGITSADVDQALTDMGEFVDVTRENLELIIRATEKHALRRSMGEIRAGQIMSRDVQCATPETTLKQALRMLKHHHLKTLPILDEERHLVGIVSLIDLIGHSRRSGRRNLLGRLGLRRDVLLEQVMSSPVTCVDSRAHVVELIPLLSGQGLHCLPVLEQGELVGIVTQTDLIAALHRDLIMHLG
ncbi:HPP family protein [Pseudomonas cavernicola]|nr:HPP family protein [Pseudomonas cavernicola]